MYRRSFTGSSWWNTPAINVPVAPDSAKYIAKLKQGGDDTIGIGVGNWAFGWYDQAHKGSYVTITNSKGKSIKIHAPAKVSVMAGDDKAFGVRCFGCDLEVGLFEAVQKDATHWTCTNYSAYRPSTTGISGSNGNNGHRGIAPSAMLITAAEVADGAILHRLKMALGPPADKRLDGKPMPIWPMDGNEKPRAGAVPEGACFRLRDEAIQRVKPTKTALVIATAMHDYGAIVGDTGGHATIKGQLNASMPADTAKALSAFTWDDYEILELGWGKS